MILYCNALLPSNNTNSLLVPLLYVYYCTFTTIRLLLYISYYTFTTVPLLLYLYCYTFTNISSILPFNVPLLFDTIPFFLLSLLQFFYLSFKADHYFVSFYTQFRTVEKCRKIAFYYKAPFFVVELFVPPPPPLF